VTAPPICFRQHDLFEQSVHQTASLVHRQRRPGVKEIAVGKFVGERGLLP
jgi:hypothetical protein